MSAVDDAIAELKKAEELLAAAKAVDAAALPKAEDVAPAVASTTVETAPTPASGAGAAVVTEGKRGPMIKNGKLFASVR